MWDKKILQPGVSWKDGFCNGLVRSRVFIPILSRGAINHPSDKKQNICVLNSESSVDNVILEHWLALELHIRGMIETIYPILLGDETVTTDGACYGNYFADGCHPSSIPDVVVESIEFQVEDQLNRLCLGTPLFENPTVHNVVDSILAKQGALLEGPRLETVDTFLPDILKMLDSVHA